MITLIWENEQSKIDISASLVETLKACMEEILNYEDFTENVEISLTFTDNEGIHEVNKETRGFDRPTDVLSFPLIETEEDGTLVIYDEDFVDGVLPLGDILLSVEKAAQQAEEFGHTFLREMAFLTVHSMLHLLGYDHERGEKEEKEMFLKQEEILRALNITR